MKITGIIRYEGKVHVGVNIRAPEKVKPFFAISVPTIESTILRISLISILAILPVSSAHASHFVRPT